MVFHEDTNITVEWFAEDRSSKKYLEKSINGIEYEGTGPSRQESITSRVMVISIVKMSKIPDQSPYW